MKRLYSLTSQSTPLKTHAVSSVLRSTKNTPFLAAVTVIVLTQHMTTTHGTAPAVCGHADRCGCSNPFERPACMEVDSEDEQPTANAARDATSMAMDMFKRTADVLETLRRSKSDGKYQYHTMQDDLGVLLRHWENYTSDKENARKNLSADEQKMQKKRAQRDADRKKILRNGALYYACVCTFRLPVPLPHRMPFVRIQSQK